MSAQLDDYRPHQCACHQEHRFYSKFESHLVRVFLIVLALFAMYKVILVEAPHREETAQPPIIVPCEPSPTPMPPPRKRPKKKKQVQKRLPGLQTRARRIEPTVPH